MKKYFFLILFSSYLLPIVTDPFSNVAENFKDISLNAIATVKKNGTTESYALIEIQGQNEVVSKNTELSNKSGRWKILDIEENSVTICHTSSGKKYCLTI